MRANPFESNTDPLREEQPAARYPPAHSSVLATSTSPTGSVSRTKTSYIAHVKLTDADVMRSEAAKEVLRLYLYRTCTETHCTTHL